MVFFGVWAKNLLAADQRIYEINLSRRVRRKAEPKLQQSTVLANFLSICH